MSSFVKPELVKGAREMGDVRPVAELIDDAQVSWKEAHAEQAKTVAPEMQSVVSMARGSDGVQQQLAEMRKVIADLTKTEFTTTYPINNSSIVAGFAVYDLQAPSKKIFPVLTPFRNRLPRVAGQGSAINWKQITSISGSGGAQAVPTFFQAELPSNSVGGLTLNLPPEITFGAADKQTKYVVMGASGSNSMISQFAGRGYEDIRALVGLSVLQSTMLAEERGLWSGRASSALQPATVAAASAGSSTSFPTAITGAATNLYIQVTAVTMLGETTAAAATSISGTSPAVKVTWAASTGAEAYNVYVGTGGTDPGTGSHYFAGSTSALSFVIEGALPTSGAKPPTSDSTGNTNAYAGFFNSLEGGTNVYVKSQNKTIALSDIQSMFLNRYQQLKADPDELWADPRTRMEISDLVANLAGSPAYGYRVNIEPSGQAGVTAGFVVSAILNEPTGKEVPLRVHPWFQPGNLAAVSYTLPFPNSEVPNVHEVKLTQDYLQLDWPVIDMNYRTSVILYGSYVAYAPDFNAWVSGIAATTPSQTAQ